jgi:hypothetical protein
MNKFEVVSFDEGALMMPQATNAISFFRSLYFKHMPEELNKSVWIAGGAVRDYFKKSKVKTDVDFFCVDRKSMADLVKWLRNNRSFKHYLITKNAIKGYVTVGDKKFNVDIVKKPFTNPTDSIEKFDFTVCCFAVNHENFYFHVSAPMDLLKQKLVINELPHPVDTLKRLNKYIKKGFSACNGTLMTLAKSLAEQDPTDESIFEFYKFD